MVPSPLRGRGLRRPGERKRAWPKLGEGDVRRQSVSRTTARRLRRDQTEAEQKLWTHLRARRLAGYRFKRQVPLGPFIVDLACYEARLVIEVDGGQHAERSKEEATRTAWLEERGFRVLRFWNNEVMENLDAVLPEILSALRGA